MGWRDFIAVIFGRKGTVETVQTPSQSTPPTLILPTELEVRRYFYDEPTFQTYGSFFAHWGGWITAGHVLTSAKSLIPDFASGDIKNWPGGLDAATIGCTPPASAPAAPFAGQAIIVRGYPAGSRYLEERSGQVYLERETGRWIAHIKKPDEPVVTGMSGGAVIDAGSGHAIGILITRNSPADLDADFDPDQSCDFIALNAVWNELGDEPLIV